MSTIAILTIPFFNVEFSVRIFLEDRANYPHFAGILSLFPTQSFLTNQSPKSTIFKGGTLTLLKWRKSAHLYQESMSSLKMLHYVTLNQYLWYLHVLNGPAIKLYQQTVKCVLNDCKYGFIASLTLKLLTQGLCKRSSDNLTPENDDLGNKSRLRREYGSLTMRAQTLTLEIRKKLTIFWKGWSNYSIHDHSDMFFTQ